MKKLEEITLENFENFFIKNLDLSHSQIKQDLFVLFVLDMKKNGFFVEFGACDGIELSNTLTLEKNFNWKGILSEPCKFWHKDLFENRKCNINIDAVWSNSNEKMLFNEVDSFKTLSNIDFINPNDDFNDLRQKTTNVKYEVNTISLKDLLLKFDSPKNIDYLSIDTEGSEFEIIKNFDFNLYNIKIITIEHNWSKNNTTNTKHKIYDLLTNNGYKNVLSEISGQDDWYIKF
jgi:FkbM family methyltransferase